jgi:hypothetical protein
MTLGRVGGEIISVNAYIRTVNIPELFLTGTSVSWHWRSTSNERMWELRAISGCTVQTP